MLSGGRLRGQPLLSLAPWSPQPLGLLTGLQPGPGLRFWAPGKGARNTSARPQLNLHTALDTNTPYEGSRGEINNLIVGQIGKLVYMHDCYQCFFVKKNYDGCDCVI